MPEWNGGSPPNAIARLFGNDSGHPIAVDRSVVVSVRQPFGTVDICPADEKLRPQSVWHSVAASGALNSRPMDDAVRGAWQRKRVEVSIPLSNGLIQLSGSWPSSSRQSGPAKVDRQFETAGATIR